LVGKVATETTRINQNHLPIPHVDELDLVVGETGALGMSIAHSGDIAGLLFEQRDPDLEQRCELAQRMLRDTGFDEQWRFDTDD
jgi:uncharacterized protein involved in propanediol utilization